MLICISDISLLYASCVLKGPLDAPYNFSVTASNISNTTFILSWGAPFSLHVAEYSSDIFYYTLCSNISMHGCRTIPSDPDCTFPRTCTSSVDLNSDSGGTKGHHINVMDPGVPIQFILVAVNGAGNGDLAIIVLTSSEAVATNTAGTPLAPTNNAGY